jgi:hypothetical protein
MKLKKFVTGKKWRLLIMPAIALIVATPTVGCLSTSAPAPTSENQQPIEIISVLGPQQPINPGGPIVEITLKNIAVQPVTSLAASLELSRSFQFDFDVTPANPLLPDKSTSAKLTLIGGGFSDNTSYPLKITGTLQDSTTFAYTKQVRIAEPSNK